MHNRRHTFMSAHRLLSRSALLLTLLLSCGFSAWGGSLTYEGKSTTTLNGATTQDPIFFRFGTGLRVTGNIHLNALDRTVKFRGTLRHNAGFVAKLATSDGVTGTVKGTLKFKRFKGTGVVNIPGLGAAALKFAPRQLVRSRAITAYIGTYITSKFENRYDFSKPVTLPLKRWVMKVTQNPVQYFTQTYTCVLTFEFDSAYAANYETTCIETLNRDGFATGGNLHFGLRDGKVAVGAYTLNISRYNIYDDQYATLLFGWGVSGNPNVDGHARAVCDPPL